MVFKMLSFYKLKQNKHFCTFYNSFTHLILFNNMADLNINHGDGKALNFVGDIKVYTILILQLLMDADCCFVSYYAFMIDTFVGNDG